MSTTNIEKAFICKTLLLPPSEIAQQSTSKIHKEDREKVKRIDAPPPCTASSDSNISCVLKPEA